MSETALGLRCPVCGGFTPHGYGHACARPASAVIPGIGAPAWWTSDAAQAKIAFHALSGQLLARWAALFPNYAWTDEQTAIDLMAAEIYALRLDRSFDQWMQQCSISN
jgi:hypothetical protein